MKSDVRQAINFIEFIKAMDILQFHAFCGMLWDEEKAVKKKWILWEGVRGYPGQDEILEAFSTEKYSWLLKARQKGGSEMAAFVQFKECVTKEKFETGIITKKLPDAKYFLKRRLLTQMKSAYDLEYEPGKRFPWPKFTDNSDTGRVVWENGSMADAFSSDNEEARSRSTNLLVFDEIRTYSTANAEELWSAITPLVDAQPNRRLIALSSAKFGSWANDMTKAIMDGEIEGIRFLFMPADIDPAHLAERKLAMKRSKNPSLFLQENPLEPEDCFKGREGAVFRNFDSSYDEENGGTHVNNVELNWGYQYCIGYDHGKTHPAVLLLCLYNRYTNHLYIFDEVFCRGKDLPEVAFLIREKLNFYKRERGSGDPNVKIADTACFAQDGRKSVAESLRDLTGIVFRKSYKYDKIGSLDRIITRFANKTITFDPRCVQTIKQFEELMWKRQAGESKKEEPVDIEDDAVDVVRYLDAELASSVKPKPKVDSLQVVLDRKQRIRELGRRGMATGADALGGDPASWLNL